MCYVIKTCYLKWHNLWMGSLKKNQLILRMWGCGSCVWDVPCEQWREKLSVCHCPGADHSQHRPRGENPDAHQENTPGTPGQNLCNALGDWFQVGTKLGQEAPLLSRNQSAQALGPHGINNSERTWTVREVRNTECHDFPPCFCNPSLHFIPKSQSLSACLKNTVVVPHEFWGAVEIE